MNENSYFPSQVIVQKSRMHSIEDHNYWIDRNAKCPYCLNGSKPVAKDIIINGEMKMLSDKQKKSLDLIQEGIDKGMNPKEFKKFLKEKKK